MRKNLFFSITASLFLLPTLYAQTTVRLAPLPRVPDLNGRVITLTKPEFPETAVAANADGTDISVWVTVDEMGNVISAKCSPLSHPMLKDAAEVAAASSKFDPLIDKNGLAVKYEGILIYTFVVDRVDWYRFGAALESTRQFDNTSLGPTAQILSAKYVAERSKLLALDAKGTELETRWKVIREVESSLKEKLQAGNRWRFEIGMALRRVTFWTMAREQTDRAELQKAIDDLPKFITGAPEGIAEQTIEALRTVSKYRVPSDLPERELRQAISNMTRNIRIVQ